MHDVKMGCAAGLGQGGLGGHLNFVYNAVKHSGGNAGIFTSSSSSSEQVISIPGPSWQNWIQLTPVRWLPATKVYWESIHFDQAVSEKLPRSPIVYHTFPGYAEYSFKKVRSYGGISVLEAATTHVKDLFRETNEEHRKYKMEGSPYNRAWVERVMREYELADYITVASQLQRESFLRNGIPERKLLFAPLGVDTDRFRPLQSQPSLVPKTKEQKFRIISVGQVCLRKGVQYLLEAVKQLRDPEIEVTLYGGIGWRKIRTLIHDYMDSGVQIKLGSGDPVPALRNSHICVHSAIEDGFGLAPLEAMAAGLPTIVTEATGMKDAIHNDLNGLIVPSRDVISLAESIARLKYDEAYRIQMAHAARMAALKWDNRQRISQYSEALSPVWKSIGGQKSVL
ncbi:glycosyltransferase family 4 protein [Paenibacillus filicis]|uniref:Glycosyltransferase family 4 protein n=1 Tax=Paenibacillus gyeongsangnamensis TaxID=3388067 RepID=A0ABT4QIE4_9BACL|nr:glycosyltransferase family 4 protein [Paenibacillus filicis]MCZ8516471.1 glycosyltransferase family 4 protein [Paenibacillus filicis]